jgi:predicted amidohydrolase
MQDLKITLIQSDLHWQEIEANLAMFEEKIWSINEHPDIIVLPEMFSTGFTMEADKLAEPPNSKTYRWMAQMAAQTKALIVGSYILKDGIKRYNRLHAVTPDGKHQYYDKRHLFRMAEEHNYYSPGSKKVIIDWKGWKILPLVCYDLRFPVWSRNTTKGDSPEYDISIFVANWPAARISSWDALLRARAIENLSYTIGLNRVGEDGNQINYCGHSAAYGPKGDELLFMTDKEDIQTISISMNDLKVFREKFPAYFDSDAFEIQ